MQLSKNSPSHSATHGKQPHSTLVPCSLHYRVTTIVYATHCVDIRTMHHIKALRTRVPYRNYR